MTERNLDKSLELLEDCCQLRGETPYDIQQKALQICGDYLGGIWSKINENQLIIERIKGGFTNQVYRCSLSESVVISNTEEVITKDVVLRLYGKKQINLNDDGTKRFERFSDLVLGILVAESGIGPKLYGTFPEGELQEYVNGRQITLDDEEHPLLLQQLAEKLAKFHSLKAPIKRKNDFFDRIPSLIQKLQQLKPNKDQLIKTLELKSLEKINFVEELNWFERIVKDLNPPIVLSHNDFTQRNILIREEKEEEKSLTSDVSKNKIVDKIVVFDHEYSNYSYRGNDFSRLFAQWGKKLFEVKPLPSDQLIKSFLSYYLNECVKIHGENYKNDERNSIEFMLKETKVFHLGFKLFMAIHFLEMEPIEGVKELTKEVLMKLSNNDVEEYLKYKENYYQQNVFIFN